MSRRSGLLLVASVVSLAASAAQAAETITYTYDARGRLIKVVHTGTINQNVQKTYDYDKADNRQTTTTSGSTNPPPS